MATDEDEDDEDEDDDDDGSPIGLDSQATPPSPSQDPTPKTGPTYLTYHFPPCQGLSTSVVLRAAWTRPPPCWPRRMP